ncbi:MAG: glycosyltransferase [Blastocatellia bacterium]
MKLVFFSPMLTQPASDHRTRILYTLLEGIADRGHSLVFVQPEGDNAVVLPFAEDFRYGIWNEARERIEMELADSSAYVVISGFEAGTDAVEWLFDQTVPARVFYDLDPWQTLHGLDASGSSPWIRSDQIPYFDLVFSIAGGPAIEPYSARYGAKEAVTLYESIDTANFHPRSPEDDFSCDLALVADRYPASEAVFENYLLVAARAVPSHRFIVFGEGWEGFDAWPDNVDLMPAGGALTRAAIYSSARIVLVPPGPHPIDYSLPYEVLEPAACGAACAVIDRPGLSEVFVPGVEIIVPESGADLVPFLTHVGDEHLHDFATNAEKRVLNDYVKLRQSTKFEQRVARKYYVGHNG